MTTPSSPPPPSLRALQATSILLLTSTSGLSAALSFFVVPRLLELPTPLLLRQFARAAAAAHRALPLPLVLPALAHAYLAYRLPGKLRLYVAAALLTLTTAPWSALVMGPIDRQMAARTKALEAGAYMSEEGQAEAEGERGVEAEGVETTHALVDKWATRNLYRPIVAFAAGCIGLYAALS
ncbi:hypothetical protein AAE478_009172 [Parahypoxylon ruwenzoriense]